MEAKTSLGYPVEKAREGDSEARAVITERLSARTASPFRYRIGANVVEGAPRPADLRPEDSDAQRWALRRRRAET